MAKGNRVPNRSDHEAAFPQVFKEQPRPIQKAAAPKKSKKKKAEVVEAEVVEEEVVEEEVVEDVDPDDDSEA